MAETSPKLAAVAIDVAAAIGAVLVSTGAGMIYAPAGVIVLGLLLLVAAAMLARRG